MRLAWAEIQQPYRVHLAQAQRRQHVIQPRRHELRRLAAAREVGFVPAPITDDRVLRPEHEHDASARELELDLPAKLVITAQPIIDPDRPASFRDARNHLVGPGFVAMRIADENVGHRVVAPRKISVRSVWVATERADVVIVDGNARGLAS